MKKPFMYGLIILIIIVAGAFLLRSNLLNDVSLNDQSENESTTEVVKDEKEDNQKQSDQVKQDNNEENEDINLSKFSYLPIAKEVSHRAVMASIENSAQARPQSGILEAPLVYEFLVEGGITRFLALYWSDIPEKIGPIRSLRPYMITIAQEYNALLLHAGASPDGFDLIKELEYKSLDQIYNGKYYWRDEQKSIPHNLYTGKYRIYEYLNDMALVEYENRFNFEEIMIISDAKASAEEITVDYWGNYKVLYRYISEENKYKRYLNSLDNPHLCEDGSQIEISNIIVQFVDTSVKDEIGRLNMDLKSGGKTLYFKNGLVSEGYWEKSNEDYTNFYDNDNNIVTLNPGKTWIQIVPINTNISYKESDDND